MPPFKLRNSKWCSVSSLFCWSHTPHCWKPHALAHLSFLYFVYLLVASALVCLFVKDRLRKVLLNSHMLIALCWLLKFDSVDTYVQMYQSVRYNEAIGP